MPLHYHGMRLLYVPRKHPRSGPYAKPLHIYRFVKNLPFPRLYNDSELRACIRWLRCSCNSSDVSATRYSSRHRIFR
jgi:hypothetical protein